MIVKLVHVHLCAGNPAWQCTWTVATMNDSVNCQTWRSCTACTPGTLAILRPRSVTQMCGGVACSSSSPYLHTWRGNVSVKQEKQWFWKKKKKTLEIFYNLVLKLNDIWHKPTEPDLWFSYGDQHNHSWQSETGIQVVQDATVWVDQQHHQAVDQDQEWGKKTLSDEEEWQEADWPPAARYRALSVMWRLADWGGFRCIFIVWNGRKHISPSLTLLPSSDLFEIWMPKFMVNHFYYFLSHI